ncbi:MAG: DUF2207 domain-containing protein [Anaerolineaceae bacterium]|nr:DUF2207 domain-containing protein [Anaerolineaceae bacterium]
MWRKMVAALVVLVILLSGVPGALAQEKSYSADRFDVDIVVQNDGSLLVTETVVFRFVGEPFTFVFREIPTDRTDGVEILEASVDGRSYPQGTNAGQVEVESDDNIRVTWHMEPTANTTRTFVLTYQMFGVVQQTEEADLLRYQPLPDEFEYTIDSSAVTLRYPASAELLETPQVTANTAQVDRSGSEVTFTRQNIEPNNTMVFEMTFARGSLIASPPAWQIRQVEQNALGPVWIGASLVILVSGIVGAVMLGRSHQPQVKKSTAVYYEPPNNLPPAIAGVLNGSGASPSWSNALATLFDLADRGILSIEELEKKSIFSGRDFEIVLLEESGNLRPHEKGLLRLLFETKGMQHKSVKMSKLSSAVTGSQWKKFTEPLEAEIKAAGYIDARRKSRRTWVMAGSFVFMILAVLIMILTVIFENLFGLWPMLVAFSFFVVFGVLMGVGSSLTILTDEARLLANEWQSFYQHLKDVTRHKAAVGETNMFNRYLPYAASYGLLHQWARFFEKEGWTQLPPYFHALNRADDGGMAAFVAMTAASSSSGGSAAGAGAAGAGAAGGGASGAG